ncbi:hypothetical protein D9611_004713 [Ephemerocybe angulata]|uniref:Phorbol-ester/DAG-type domain-containing protein n=1 Tax=Ephemerocybe angulata TaxID=980116 RepID=A0A8H5B2X7_9AGAR|nr:hypothetical protein D9611_004713 [Tulosesus angulatus]
MESSSSNRAAPPRIDTSVSQDFIFAPSISTGGHISQNAYTLYDPSSTSVSAAGIPSVRISTSSTDPRQSTSTRSDITVQAPNPSSRAKNESRKLLTHVLYQLLNRRRPPPVSQAIAELGREAAEGGAGAISDILRGVASMGRSMSKDPSRVTDTDDREGSDDEEDGAFSTETTFELMTQLQDLLAMSVSLKWQLFDDDAQAPDPQKPTKEKERSSRFRRSFQPGSKTTRSPSPGVGDTDRVATPHLLSLCISVLSSVVSEDCRFQITSHRPSRPPNSLQIVTLNVAQFLINTHRHDPKIVSQVGFATIPAFSTFPREMQGRLMIFFQDVVLRGLLETLQRSQRFVEYDISPNPVMSPIDTSISNGPVVQIQIDEAPQSATLDEVVRNFVKVQSSNAPHHAPIVYYLSSLVAPLLSAILEATDVTSLHSTHELAVRFYGLIEIMASLKVDAYNDLLQIAAYHSPQSRKSACSLLSTLWPKIIGHATISRSLSIPLSLDFRKTTIPWIAHRGHKHQHQFVPWQFIQKSSWSNFQGIPQHACSFCSVSIDGFGLLCPFCMCAVHFDCYDPPGGTLMQQYTMAHDPSAQRVSMLRVSAVIPNGGEPSLRHNSHVFELVTVFTLCLCYLCHQPLWGCIAQGAKCSTCSFIAHTSCLLSPSMPTCGDFQLDSENMTVDHRALRRSALAYYPELRWSEEQIGMLSYEEIVVIYDNLRTQLQLISNGIALNSIIVIQRGKNAAHTKDFMVEEFELHSTLDSCKRLLASPTSQKSTATIDYIEENRISPLEHSILYDFSNLVYLSTAMKSPISVVQNATPSPSPSANLLNVDFPETQGPEPVADSVAHPYEAVPLSHMREILNVEFNIHHPAITKVLLNHMFNLSFFERLDPRQDITYDPISDDALCVFPLPLGLDMSTDVETLVSSIETCLLDLDLSVNEFGFLLVIRKFWPNGLMSDYGLRRLARSILSWIIVEDDNLATILRDYVAKQKPLPGVRTTGDMPPWPFAHPARSMTLLSRYAVPWLLSLHDQDRDVYAEILYDTCLELADDRVVGSEVFDENMTEMEANSIKRLDAALFAVVKITQASVTFTCSEDLMLRWLTLVSELGIPSKPIAGLNRLFPRDSDFSNNRLSSVDSDLPKPNDNEATAAKTDPFSTLTQVAQQSSGSLTQALDWLGMIARSGIDIPINVFNQFTTLVTGPNAILGQAHSLVHIITLCLWLRSIGRQFLQTLLGRIHTAIGPQIVSALKGKDNEIKSISLAIIRHTFAGCVLIYGCDRADIFASGLLEESEVKDLPSRRKLGSRALAMDDPIVIDPGILRGVTDYLRLDIHTVNCLIAKFFHLFFTGTSLVASYEVDNFILKNGPLLADCAWKFYGIQRHDISALRAHFLLRTIVVDAEPFQNLIKGGLDEDLHWERRLVTMNRLSRILVDITSPAFNIDGRQWRSSVGEIFATFFSMLWSDSQEEIRLSVRAVASGLLPAQIEAISQCWNETLSKSPMTNKVHLISFLIQLRSHLPGWGLISWDNLIETMAEYVSDNDPDLSAFYSTYSTQDDLDTIHLSASALMLSLAMVADGVPIDAITLLKIKVQLIKLIGFSDLTVMTGQDALYIQYGEASELLEVAFPCVEGLVSVIDAPHTVEIPASVWGGYQEQEDRNIPVLVGFAFADVILNIISTVEALESLPVLPLKNLLESVYMMLHKFDFDVQPARSVQPLLRQAMDRIIELSPKNLNYEVRQLALTVVQAFCKRCFSIIRVGQTVFTILENVTEVIVSLNHQSQDALVVQGKSLLLSLLSAHTSDGLMVNIFKRPLKPEFFNVLKQVLEPPKSGQDSDRLASYLWRDTLNRSPECDPASMQTVINNLGQFVELVYSDGYSQELLTVTGQQAASIMRRLSDSLFDSVDSSPLLSMLARLSKANRKYSRELLPYIETTLRIALTRGSINAPCLIQLINATQHKVLNDATPLGKVASTLVEILSDSLRLKARVLPTTLKAIIESLSSDGIPIYPDDPNARFKLLMNNLVENGCYFLDHHTWLDVQTENDFNVSLVVARIIFRALEQDPTATNSSMEITYKLVNSLRSWVVLAIAALQEDSGKSWVLILYQHFGSFSHAYLATMRTYAQSNLSSESAASDINLAYIAAKVWLMVAQRVSSLTGTADGPMLRIWNDVWPVFESLIDGLEMEARAGLSSSLLVLVSATIADLLIFLRNLRTPLALEITSHLEILNRLKIVRGEDAKVTRALRAMAEAPVETGLEHMLEQVAKEIVATEKMKNIEAKRDVGRGAFRKESGR